MIIKRQTASVIIAALTFILFEATLFFYIDRPLALYTHSLDATNHDLIDWFRAITDYGKSKYYLWPCGIIVILTAFLSRAKDATAAARDLAGYIGIRCLFLFATIALSGIIADIIKPIIGRARPIEFLGDNLYGFHPFTSAGFAWNSMPSGHATTVFTLAFALSSLYPRLRLLWLTLAIILAASRVMVDAHFLSDICAGAMLGYVTVALFHRYGMFHLSKVIFPIDNNPPLS